MFARKKKQEQELQDAGVGAREAWAKARVELDALAAEPGSPDRWSAVAARWAELALTPPTHPTPSGRVPMGFAVRPGGAELQDCALTERALAIFDTLIERGHDPVRHLQQRAHLLVGWHEFAEASADLDRAAGYVPDDLAESSQARGLLHHHAAMLRAQAASMPAVSERDLGQLHAAVAAVAPSIGRIVPHTPPRVDLYDRTNVPIAPDPRLLALDAHLAARGVALLAWVENSWFAELFGQRLITGAWGAPDGSYVISAGVVGEIDVADAESWCTDGRFVTTTASRGRNGFGGGPWEDSMQVDAALGIDDVIALHEARLRALLATTPGLATQPIATGEDWVAMQEALRQRKAEFRLAQGLSETEARGIPLQFPDVAVPMLKAAARDAVAAAHAAATGQAEAA